MELIRVKFDGRLASSGRLQFYEYSRSQYATARFIITIERFRRSGEITERITSATSVDVLVETSTRGSFIQDIIVPAVQAGLATAISAPLSALISYVWHLLATRSETNEDLIVQFAEIRLAEMETSTAIERERTRQMEIWQSIVAGERASAKEALQLARWALDARGNAAVGRLEVSRQQIEDIRDEFEAECQREREFADHITELQKIDEQTINQLTSRLRPMVPEMALPLRNSADRMTISHGEKGGTYANITPDVVARIKERSSEDEIVKIIGHVRSYDRDAGVGKVISPQLLRVLNFTVPLSDRQRLIDRILEAMRLQTVILTCRRTVDMSGLPTSLILIDVNLNQDDVVDFVGEEDV